METKGGHQCVIVFGAGRGIGLQLVKSLMSDSRDTKIFAQYRDPDRAKALLDFSAEHPDFVEPVNFDPGSEEALQSWTESLQGRDIQPVAVYSTIGFLHSEAIQPEKSSRDLSSNQLQKYFQGNCVVNALIAKHCKKLFSRKLPAVFAVVSGRVGSIDDNVMGGWYGYRMAKAALNMMLKNFSIELKNSRFPVQVFSLHPGTVDTELSSPFSKNVKHSIFSAEESVGQMLNAVQQSLADHPDPTPLRFIAYDGEVLKF